MTFTKLHLCVLSPRVTIHLEGQKVLLYWALKVEMQG